MAACRLHEPHAQKRIPQWIPRPVIPILPGDWFAGDAPERFKRILRVAFGVVCLHRYRPDTVSIVLNEYLREYAARLQARRSHLQQVAISAAATPAGKSKAIKETGGIDKTLVELAAYENEVLYPLATQQVRLDLDDGVKVNYAKLGKALKRIAGLDAPA